MSGNWLVDNIRIRPVRSADEGALVAFYAGLSVDSRRARFLGCTAGLDLAGAHQLCGSLNVDEAGFVAERIDADGHHIVGHVCMTDTDEGGLEISVAVADAWQGHGIGRRLVAPAVAWAEHNDVDRLDATALTDNWRVLRLLRSSGHPAIVLDIGCGVSSVSIFLKDEAV